MAKKEPILCYVDRPWAYFTTQRPQKQWGDDWDDAPYEHNAGPPYLPHEDDIPWDIIKIAWDGDFMPPNENTLNSRWSVRDINNKRVAWLRSYDNKIQIFAGTSLSRFKALIKKGGGTIYMEEL